MNSFSLWKYLNDLSQYEIGSLIAVIIIIYFVISIKIIVFNRYCDLSFLNPINNYDEYYSLNVFGVIIVTILLNIICLPYAIIYWICKLIYWLFTVGRD